MNEWIHYIYEPTIYVNEFVYVSVYEYQEMNFDSKLKR